MTRGTGPIDSPVCGEQTDNGRGIVFTCIAPAGSCQVQLGTGRVMHVFRRDDVASARARRALRSDKRA